ncbi:MAG TPA: ribosome biogenesis GTPase Der [Dehalococcoidia bacterium]|nr:ribosome biogenesis GTPase Der [Dehalococcoidia bacterium]
MASDSGLGSGVGTELRRPVIAIVGRPNVGKSTLFNRLLRSRKAIVEDIPGTTRDRLYGEVEWGLAAFTLIDTGGLEPTGENSYSQQIRSQVEVALAEADVVLFLVDAVEGATATDGEIAEMLRRSAKPVLLLANKADNQSRAEMAVQFYELGLGEPLPISAYHGRGLEEVQDRLEELLPAAREAEAPPDALALAIVGRPNVGKSSLLNAILGEQRVIVSEVPGTTRDAIDTPFEYEGHQLVFIDTAGIRRPGKVGTGIERYSVMRARQAVRRAEVVLLVIDASAGLMAQDTHIAGLALEEHKGLIIVANKWDLLEESDTEPEEFSRKVLNRVPFLPWAPLVIVSAEKRFNLSGMLDLALEIGEVRGQRVPTHELNLLMRQAVVAHQPPGKGKRRFKLLYVTQAEVRPPTFVFFVNDPTLLHFSYHRYLENVIRKQFGFEGTAIRLVFRGRSED